MRTLTTISTLMLLVFFVFLSQSCATIFGSKANTLVFKADTTQTAQVYIDGELVGEAPGKIKLPKAKIQHGSKMEIKAEGYEVQEYTLIRKVHPWYTVADFLVGGIWLAIDYGTGNILRPIPRSFTYTLEESENQ